MSRSIVSNEPECFVCGTPYQLHRHHIYPGAGRRKVSEKFGCWCYLCYRHHNGSNAGVHFNKELDLKLRRLCQKRWEVLYGDREAFRRTFGASYL